MDNTKDFAESTPSRMQSCKFCYPDISANKIDFLCVADTQSGNNAKIVCEHDCENCKKYKSKYIEYPLTISGIKNEKIEYSGLFHEIGCLCRIKPVAEEYNGKTFLGIYIGELPIMISSRFSNQTKMLSNTAITNPAIFVPELKKIVFGCESWWSEIRSEEELKEITNEEIQKTWYVKLLKESFKNKGD